MFREQDHPESRDNIGMLAVDGESEPVWLLRSEFHERNAGLSPDGRWMAYQSDESGRFEVYVRPFPNVDDGRWAISNAGGIYPSWSRDGRELFYLEPGSPPRLMSASVETDPDFVPGARRPLIDWPYFAACECPTYDVSPDGERFLALKAPLDEAGSGAPRVRINVIVNWFEELTERVPVP